MEDETKGQYMLTV